MVISKNIQPRLSLPVLIGWVGAMDCQAAAVAWVC